MHKFNRLLHKHLNNEVLEVLLSICILVPFFIYYYYMDENNFFMFVDFTIFTTVLAVFISKAFANWFAGLLRKRIEDSVKLELNADKLVRIYPCEKEMISYQNTDEAVRLAGRWGSPRKQKFPVVQIHLADNFRLSIVDSKTEYQLPPQLEENRHALMQAHSKSTVYNQLNIRVDDIRVSGEQIELHTSRTSFFSSLVTNRAMDYDYGKGVTVRDLYCYGPFLPELSESKLSNHLGVNGFIQTADEKLIFVQRGGDVSIGKNSLGTSVGASVKAKYALNAAREFTAQGLCNSIVKEIEDELCIPQAQISFALDKNIIAIYRDIVEGGKPQLLFHAKVGLRFSEVEQYFYKTAEDSKSKWSAEVRMRKDGSKIIGMDLSELKQLYIQPNTVVYRGKRYHIMPSASASIVMLIQYLQGGGGQLV